jgi:hypothetical protein
MLKPSNEVGELKQAIDTNNLEQVKALMSRNPELHRAPLGYGCRRLRCLHCQTQ